MVKFVNAFVENLRLSGYNQFTVRLIRHDCDIPTVINYGADDVREVKLCNNAEDMRSVLKDIVSFDRIKHVLNVTKEHFDRHIVDGEGRSIFSSFVPDVTFYQYIELTSVLYDGDNLAITVTFKLDSAEYVFLPDNLTSYEIESFKNVIPYLEFFKNKDSIDFFDIECDKTKQFKEKSALYGLLTQEIETVLNKDGSDFKFMRFSIGDIGTVKDNPYYFIGVKFEICSCMNLKSTPHIDYTIYDITLSPDMVLDAIEHLVVSLCNHPTEGEVWYNDIKNSRGLVLHNMNLYMYLDGEYIEDETTPTELLGYKYITPLLRSLNTEERDHYVFLAPPELHDMM